MKLVDPDRMLNLLQFDWALWELRRRALVEASRVEQKQTYLALGLIERGQHCNCDRCGAILDPESLEGPRWATCVYSRQIAEVIGLGSRGKRREPPAAA